MAEVDLSTADRRMKELFGAMDTFVAEMERIHYLAETYWIYKLVADNIVGFNRVLPMPVGMDPTLLLLLPLRPPVRRQPPHSLRCLHCLPWPSRSLSC